MLSMVFGFFFVFFVYLAMPANVNSHSLFIQSSRYHVHEGKSSPLFFCYGHHIPVDDGVRANKLKSVCVHTPSGEIRKINVRNETCLHSYMVTYDAPGTYVLAAETNPGYYTAYIDKKGRKRQTIKPKSTIIDQAKTIERSLYSKQYTKTYVTCEKPSGTFPKRIGQSLELVPVSDLSNLKPGDELILKIYLKGSPYSGEGTWDATYNGFSTQPEDNFYSKTKVSGDTLQILIPNSGRWFVRYFIKVDATGSDIEKYTQEKRTATLVFEIPNERKKPKE
jgi:uncharacterized GH25 family protein